MSAAPDLSGVAMAEPLFPTEEVRSPETLMAVPMSLEVTSTEIVHVWFAPRPLRESVWNVIVVPPAGARGSVSQFVDAFAGVAMTIPAGSEFENARFVTGRLSRFSRV